MAFTVIGGWKMEDGEATVEHKTRITAIIGVAVYSDELEREIITKKYTCFCHGEEDLPAKQNPGNLSLPWKCQNRHFTNPRGDYKTYEEVWQTIGNWAKIN